MSTFVEMVKTGILRDDDVAGVLLGPLSLHTTWKFLSSPTSSGELPSGSLTGFMTADCDVSRERAGMVTCSRCFPIE
jgi:hypothetical protein